MSSENIITPSYIQLELAHTGILSLNDLIILQTHPDIIRNLKDHFNLKEFDTSYKFLQNYRKKYYTRYGLYYLNRETCLIEAAKIGDLEVMKLAIHWGVIPTYLGYALCQAAKEGQIEAVNLMIAHGVFNNRSQYYNENAVNRAMILASDNGHFDIVQMLLMKEIDQRQELDDDRTFAWIVSSAANGGYMDIIHMVLEPPFNATNIDGALIWAARGGHLEPTKFLLQFGDTYIKDATVVALLARHMEVVKLLLPHTDFDPDIFLDDKYDRSQIFDLLSNHGVSDTELEFATVVVDITVEDAWCRF